jgi:hypothetical protein
MILRGFAAGGILLAGIIAGPWLVLPAAVLHALAWFGIELIFIAAGIDAFFGVGHGVPYYTIAAVIIVGGAEWVKPRLSFYT